MNRRFIMAFFLVCATATLLGAAGGVSVTRGPGGSIKTDLGFGVVLNKESSLSREWVTIHDSSLPADLVGTVGIHTIYEPDRVRGDYYYQAEYKISARESLSAIEVRFLTFDVWGNPMRPLSATEVFDLKAGDSKEFTPRWNAYSENDVSDFYASIAYIARVRTATGKVLDASVPSVLEEAKKFSQKFTVQDLEPKPETK
jgi:hypothetical protein